MKRLVASLMALSAAAALSAQVTFGIGARGQFGFGLGSSFAGDDVDEFKLDPFKSILAGGAVIGRLGFDAVPGLFIQPEIGFSHNQVGYKIDYEDSEKIGDLSYSYEYEGGGSFSYNSIDIPIIIGYDVDVSNGLVISPYAGLNLSIPVGEAKWSSDAETVTTTVTYNNKTSVTSTKGESNSTTGDVKVTVIPGLLVGAGVGYKFDSHNMILGDLRYLLDFSVLQGEYKVDGKTYDWDILTRRGLTIGVNYVYFF